MTTPTNKTRELLYITIFTVVLFLLVDFFAGSWLLSIARKEQPKDAFRIAHDIYHHTLKPNYNGIGFWGPGNYRGYGTYHVCTNGSALKDRCENVGVVEKSFDIAFIGDSFTEGVGMPYEDSFVGMVANKYPELKIANLGVVSYAPSIYLAKLKEFYKQGYSFKNVIVFIDIGDVQDEALTYEVINGKVLSRDEQIPDEFIPKLRRYASRVLPLTGFIWNKIKDFSRTLTIPPLEDKNFTRQAVITAAPTQTLQSEKSNSKKVEVSPSAQTTPNVVATLPIQIDNTPAMPNAPKENGSIYDFGYTRSAWTFNAKTPGYGPDGIQGTINKMTRSMEDLYELTRANGSTLSVGVYPWPGQIKYDVEESLQVKVWKEFCLNRCKHFYNTFPTFFKLKAELGEDALLFKFYMLGDMHFNAEGNRVVAETLIKEGVR